MNPVGGSDVRGGGQGGDGAGGTKKRARRSDGAGSGRVVAAGGGKDRGRAGADELHMLWENRSLRQKLATLKESKHELEIQAKDLQNKLLMQNEVIKRYRKRLTFPLENDSGMRPKEVSSKGKDSSGEWRAEGNGAERATAACPAGRQEEQEDTDMEENEEENEADDRKVRKSLNGAEQPRSSVEEAAATSSDSSASDSA